MKKSDLIEELKLMLGASVDRFGKPPEPDLERHLAIAAQDYARLRPRTYLGTLTLTAGESRYPAPDNLIAPKWPLWGVAERNRTKPWEKHYPGRLPALTLAEDADGRFLSIDPAPDAAQVAAFGATYKFYYFIAHVIGEEAADTTIPAVHRGALLIRACAQAALELANMGVTKPVQFHNGLQTVPANSTPVALHRELMRVFEEMLDAADTRHRINREAAR